MSLTGLLFKKAFSALSRQAGVLAKKIGWKKSRKKKTVRPVASSARVLSPLEASLIARAPLVRSQLRKAIDSAGIVRYEPARKTKATATTKKIEVSDRVSVNAALMPLPPGVITMLDIIQQHTTTSNKEIS